MVSAMREEEGLEDLPKRIKIDLKSVPEKTLVNFVTKQSARLLDRLSLSQAFLDADPKEWPDRADYQEASAIIQSESCEHLCRSGRSSYPRLQWVTDPR